MKIRNIVGNSALVLVSTVLTVATLELGCRAWRGPSWLVDWPNFISDYRMTKQSPWGRGRFLADPDIGYVPQPGFSSPEYNNDSHGFRLTRPDAVELRGPVVLASGDSFTEGAEVSDSETWPSYLELKIGVRVLNAGVSGYSLAQAILLTERFVRAMRPAVIVLGFIGDDIQRGERSVKWEMGAAYFEISNGSLELRNVPVPPPTNIMSSLSIWQRLLGRSMLVDEIRKRTGWKAEWTNTDKRALPPGGAEPTICPMMHRLAGMGVPILVVAQYEAEVWAGNQAYTAEQRRLSQKVLQCAHEAGLGALDTFDMLSDLVRSEGQKTVYRRWHYSPEGNRVVAHAIAAELNRLHILPDQSAK